MPVPFTPPMECLLVKKLPDGPEWVYELKLDGYRAQAIREADGGWLLSRNGKDLSKRFPRVISALNHALLPDTVVDGELVAMDEDGRPSFQALQNAQLDTAIIFYAFDILMDKGQDVRALHSAIGSRTSIPHSAPAGPRCFARTSPDPLTGSRRS